MRVTSAVTHNSEWDVHFLRYPKGDRAASWLCRSAAAWSEHYSKPAIGLPKASESLGTGCPCMVHLLLWCIADGGGIDHHHLLRQVILACRLESVYSALVGLACEGFCIPRELSAVNSLDGFGHRNHRHDPPHDGMKNTLHTPSKINDSLHRFLSTLRKTS